MTIEEYSDQALEPVIIAAKTHRGFMAELVRQLEDMGMIVQRQAVGRWLHRDRAKRTQPSFGMGLILLEAGTRAERVLGAKKEGLDIPATVQKPP